MEPETPRSFGRYQMIRRIGQGGMAEVYLAEVVGLGGFRKKVAIKRLLPHYAQNERFVTMLEDEARIAAAIRHPNVAEVLDFGSVGGQHFIAMEYIDGIDLATVLRGFRLRDTLLPLPAALYIARGVAEGLHAAHALRDSEGRPQQVIHRDVSPHNILISYEGAVKLIDFGVAKAANNSTKTRSGVIKGKLQYMSPEQAQAQSLDGRADIFSLGMTLYKMLTGRLPFTGQNEYQVYDQILRKNPIPPRRLMAEIPERVDAIVLKALRKSRDRRFQTAQEMADLLDVALAEIDVDYGARELGELLSGDRPQPSTVENLYEEDFIASVSGVDVPADVDERAIDRLTDVHSVVGLKPGADGPSVEISDALFEAEPSGPAAPDVEPSTGVTPPAPSPTRPTPAVARPVARAIPVAVATALPVGRPSGSNAPGRAAPARPVVPVPVSPWDRPSVDTSADGLEATMALSAVAHDSQQPSAADPLGLGLPVEEDPTIAIVREEAADATLPLTPDAPPVIDAGIIADFDDEPDGNPTAPTQIADIDERPFPWTWIALGAVVVLVVVVIVGVVMGGDDPPADEDEPPAVLKIGTGLPGEPPPTPSRSDAAPPE